MKKIIAVLLACVASCSTNDASPKQSYVISGSKIEANSFDDALMLMQEKREIISGDDRYIRMPYAFIQDQRSESIENTTSYKISDIWITFLSKTNAIPTPVSDEFGFNGIEIAFNDIIITDDSLTSFFKDISENPSEIKLDAQHEWGIPAILVQDIWWDLFDGCQYSEFTPGTVNCHDTGNKCWVAVKVSNKWSTFRKECDGDPILQTFIHPQTGILEVVVHYDIVYWPMD